MLSSEDKIILDFERAWWLEPGAKDQAIEFSLGLFARDYYNRLGVLVTDPAAHAYDPMTVRRLVAMIETPADSEIAI